MGEPHRELNYLSGRPRTDAWRVPALGLWLVFFAVGLVPEWVFHGLRTVGAVATQRALVNSPYFITVAFAVYLGAFTFARCRAAGLPEANARGNALQSALLALVAFLPFPLQLFQDAMNIPVADLRRLVYVVGSTKLVAWAYLLSLLIRYYMFGHSRVFAHMLSLFPSVHRAANQPPPLAPPSTKPSANKEVPSPVDGGDTSR